MGRPGSKRKDLQVLTPAEIKSKKVKDKVVDEGSIEKRMGELKVDAKVNNLISEDGFIRDLLWVYDQWGGRNQLLKEVQEDSQVRREFVQLLLRMEFKKTEIREKKAAQGKLPAVRGKVMHSQASDSGSDGGSSKKSFLFLMKGLDSKDEEKKAKALDDQISPHNEDVKEEKEYEYSLQDEEEDEVVMEDGMDE